MGPVFENKKALQLKPPSLSAGGSNYKGLMNLIDESPFQPPLKSILCFTLEVETSP